MPHALPGPGAQPCRSPGCTGSRWACGRARHRPRSCRWATPPADRRRDAQASPAHGADRPARLRHPGTRDPRGRPARSPQRHRRAMEPVPGVLATAAGLTATRGGHLDADAAAGAARRDAARREELALPARRACSGGCGRPWRNLADARAADVQPSANCSTARWPVRSVPLSQIPGSLETDAYPEDPQAPGVPVKPLDRRRFLTRSVAALGAGGVSAAMGSMAGAGRAREHRREAGLDRGCPHRWPGRPRSVRRPAPGRNPHRAPGSGHVRGPRQHCARLEAR